MSSSSKERILNSFQVAKNQQPNNFVPFAEEILWGSNLNVTQFLEGVWELCDEFVKLKKEKSTDINLPLDLSKDTLIKVKNYDNAKWQLRYFKAFSEDGIECYVNGYRSIEVEDPEKDYIVWKYAKLLTSKDIAMINFL